MTTYESLTKEREYLDSLIRNASVFLQDAPKGTVNVKIAKKNLQYYFYPGQKYLSKRKKESLIKALIQKSYEKKILKVALQQKEAIEKFLIHYNPNAISDIVKRRDARVIDWIDLHEDFCKCTPEATTEEVPKTDAGVDLARNLIAICSEFLQSKGGSL